VRYRKVRPHARGGLGEVFLAVDEELQREVALKEIQEQHADRGDSRARFLREARVTGRLEHPGIVPVHGLGCYADGRPFYAMRFIHGDSLQEAIARFHQADSSRRDTGERTLALRELLGRFVDVCNAVAYAHSRGVLHRDLKPANVLLGQYGETLVVDWGLARPLTPAQDGTVAEMSLDLASTPEAALTQVGRFVGTPAFASPEQAGGRLAELGPTSDVYSLGAMLFCLLTGQTPFAGAALEVVLQRVQRGEFPPPRQVKGSVPKALEAVCCKAMALEPGQRYPTARALAEDVERWLADEPVSAWPEPPAVKAGRWVRKNRVLATSTGVALMVALLLGTAGAVLWQQQRLWARQQAEAGLEQAAKLRDDYRFADAEAMLVQVGGWTSQAADGPLRQRLAGAKADLELARDLDAVRQKAATLVEGKWAPFRVLVEEYHKVLAAHGLDVLEADLDGLAQRIRASEVRDSIVAALDDWARAESNRPRMQRLAALANRADEPDPWRQAVRQALVLLDGKRLLGLLDEAQRGKPTPGVVLLLAQVLGSKKAKVTPLLRQLQRERPRDFWVHFTLGSCLQEEEKHQEAANCFLVAVVLRPDCAGAHSNLGRALQETGKLDEAMECYHKALAIDPRLPQAHNNLGAALEGQGKVEKAIACYQKAIALDPKDARARTNLGAALYGKGKVDEAIECYRQAIAIDPRHTPAHINLGIALKDRRKFEEAIACLHRALVLDPMSPVAHHSLGNTLHDAGKVEEAIAHLRKALALDPRFARAHYNLGIVFADQGKADEAIACFRQAITLNPCFTQAHYNLGSALLRKGKGKEASECFHRVLALDPSHARAHNGLGLAVADQGKLEQAIACYHKAIALAPRLVQAHTNLGNAFKTRGQVDEAIASYQKAVALDPSYALAHYNLANAFYDKGKLDEAIAEYREAVRLNKDYAQAYCNLGRTLRSAGDLQESLAAYRRGHAVGSKRPGWHYPSAAWVRQAERLVELDQKLAAVLAGKAKPLSAAEQIEFAQLCKMKKLSAASVRLYRAAFARQPLLADDHRYEVGCAAALAGTAQGKDSAGLDDNERAELRYGALSWLQDLLGVWARYRASLRPGSAEQVRKALLYWQQDADLAAVRDPAALGKLPEAEQVAWRNLWAQVDALLARSGPGK
jgi:tetratricopeptide (TPR) repeat protein/tRNA A-37 threonylcarbamoyl transferase component Bud32